MVVTQKQLAECFGVSLRRVQQLQKDGIIHRDRSVNGYHLEECNRAYLEYKINAETGRSTAISKERMQAEHEKVKMDISKLKLKRLQRESFDANAVTASWMSVLTDFSAKLDALPAKIVMSISGDDINTQIETAKKAVEDVKKSLYDWDPKDIDNSLADEDLEDDDEDDDE